MRVMILLLAGMSLAHSMPLTYLWVPSIHIQQGTIYTPILTVTENGQVWKHGDPEQPLEYLSEETLRSLVLELVAMNRRKR